jgi:hypothetical protein
MTRETRETSGKLRKLRKLRGRRDMVRGEKSALGPHCSRWRDWRSGAPVVTQLGIGQRCLLCTMPRRNSRTQSDFRARHLLITNFVPYLSVPEVRKFPIDPIRAALSLSNILQLPAPHSTQPDRTSPPKNALPRQSTNLFTLPGTNYCGPGGAGTPTDRVDAACARHDLCYQNAGVSWRNNVGLAKTTSQQKAAIKACDADL